MKETDVAVRAIQYFREVGWEIYQEVQIPHKYQQGYRVIDIVGIKDGRVMICEVKTSFSSALLHQTARWIGWADEVWMAAPMKPKPHASRIGGIGILEIDLETHNGGRLLEPICGEAIFLKYEQWKSFLTEEHKLDIAGSRAGKVLTPYKQMCKLVSEYVKEHDKCYLSALIPTLAHLYSAKGAVSSLRTAVWRGDVPNVVIRQAYCQVLSYEPGVNLRRYHYLIQIGGKRQGGFIITEADREQLVEEVLKKEGVQLNGAKITITNRIDRKFKRIIHIIKSNIDYV
jgi:hypothetical protein